MRVNRAIGVSPSPENKFELLNKEIQKEEKRKKIFQIALEKLQTKLIEKLKPYCNSEIFEQITILNNFYQQEYFEILKLTEKFNFLNGLLINSNIQSEQEIKLPQNRLETTETIEKYSEINPDNQTMDQKLKLIRNEIAEIKNEIKETGELLGFFDTLLDKNTKDEVEKLILSFMLQKIRLETEIKQLENELLNHSF